MQPTGFLRNFYKQKHSQPGQKWTEKEWTEGSMTSRAETWKQRSGLKNFPLVKRRGPTHIVERTSQPLCLEGGELATLLMRVRLSNSMHRVWSTAQFSVRERSSLQRWWELDPYFWGEHDHYVIALKRWDFHSSMAGGQSIKPGVLVC